eukprot:COSAG02_NODE_65753_length_257_cov_0.658228_1_plen_64_part_10
MPTLARLICNCDNAADKIEADVQFHACQTLRQRLRGERRHARIVSRSRSDSPIPSVHILASTQK